MSLQDAIAEVLLDETQIQTRVRQLAQQISEDYADQELVMICLLRGSVFFAIDLARQLPNRLLLDFMAISRFGDPRETAGVVRIIKDLEENITGKPALVVEDIVDTGLTLRYLLKNLEARNPQSLHVCTLLDKRARRIVELPLRYVGFEIPDKFVVGYGLDHKQLYRNLPFIATLKSPPSA
ncbi:MAG: hypoxanthine phosphoribosyltransferase [Acidobacteria bacterium]|nr:hypoxanthine phosphoribosyltransferase [Acidobacteriota bacterium]